MVLELITRLEIDRTPSSSQGNEEENNIKVNVREERDCDNRLARLVCEFYLWRERVVG